MRWLSNPKVKLALFVNGLYFLSFYAPPSPYDARPYLLKKPRASLAERPSHAPPAGVPEYVPLPPPSAPSRAAAYESGGMLHVSLSKDLTLVKRPGRTLLLSPFFSVRTYPPEEPGFVRLNFIIYTGKETSCPGGCPLTITADGETLWALAESPAPPSNTSGWSRKRFPPSSGTLGDGRVLETMAAESLAAEMPYNLFLDMLSAKSVIIKLGPDRVELTADQIEALRDMHRRIPQPGPPPTAVPDYD
jgi:hypothetical protein